MGITTARCSTVLVALAWRSSAILIPKRLVTSHKMPLNELPEQLRLNIEKWRVLNRDWDFVYVDDNAQASFMMNNCTIPRCSEAYSMLVSGAARADLFRVAYMHFVGGFWFDADVKPGRLAEYCGLASAPATSRLFLIREPKRGHVRFMVIGGHDHPFLKANLYRQIANIYAAKSNTPSKPHVLPPGALTTTGPFTLGRTLCEPFKFASPADIILGYNVTVSTLVAEANEIATHCTAGYFSGVDPGESVHVPGERETWARTFGRDALLFRYDVCMGYWHRPSSRGLPYQKVLGAMNVTHHLRLPARVRA